MGPTMERLKNKVACITGAGSGIGRATALLFAREGAKVLVTDLRGDAAQAVVDEITAEGGAAHAMAVDVGVEAQLQAMIDRTLTRFGRIDILYNNAVDTSGKGKADKDFLAFDPVRFFEIVRVNVLGGVLASRMAIPHMLKQGGGAILFTSSTSSLGGDVAQFSYGGSKAMLNWYVQTIAATFGKQGIRCNGILPGVIETPAMKAWANQEMHDAFLDLQNVPRLGLPEDIASLALFLASDESMYINGALMRADGGMSCTVPHVQVVRHLLKPGA
jgi:NAD(P)-dependent dehydrogenase (short-subunit alcohol dehydrogenase family)